MGEMEDRLLDRLRDGDRDTQPPAVGGRVLERLGEFRIIREIGRGGMGVVYEAEQESLLRQVAVKVLPQGPLLGEKQMRRFEREAKIAARLHHTNIVPIFGVGEQDGLHYYVMQYIRGVGLDRVLDEGRRMLAEGAAAEPPDAGGTFTARDAVRALRTGRFPQPGRSPADPNGTAGDGSSATAPRSEPCAATQTQPQLPEYNTGGPFVPPPVLPESAAANLARLEDPYWKSVARIGVQAADALDYAHSQGTLHRDVKPGNLLLDAQGTVWVTDFGLAKALEKPDLTDSGDLLGTLLYMAPEQYEGAPDTRSDIYGLGATLYELATFQPIFQAAKRHQLIGHILHGEPRRPRQINPKVPRDLETIILKSIARDPARRYQTAAELRDDLQCFLHDRPIRARRVTSAERLWRWCKRNKALAALGGVALLLLVLVAVTASLGYLFTSAALEREAQQRRRAEDTSALAATALEQIFKQLAPERLVASAELTFQLPEGTEIEVPLQQPLSRDTAALLEKLLEFYDRLAEQSDGDGRLRRQQAQASRRVGDIRHRLGQLEPAKKAYVRSAELYQELRGEAPDDTQLAVELARVHNALGQVFWKQRRFEEARKSYQTAVHVLHSVSSATPAIQYELAQTYYHLGSHGGLRASKAAAKKASAKKPGPPESREYLQKAVALLEALVKEHPAIPAYRHLLALCYRDLPVGAGQRDPSARGRAVNLLRTLAEQHPHVPDYRHDLCQTLGMLYVPFWFVPKDGGPLLQDLQEALELSKDLVREHPSIPDFRISNIVLHQNLGQMQRRDGQWEQAEANFRQALKMQDALIRLFPDAPQHQIIKARYEISLADVLRDRKRQPEAIQVLESSAGRLEHLGKQPAETGFLNFTIAAVYDRLAALYRDVGETEKAAAASQRAKKLRRPPTK